jgi:membrane fusion protein (multidrug efflux system)
MAAPKRTDVSKANRESAMAKVQQAAAAVQAAKIALKRTEIRAPVAGTVSRKTAQIGQQLSAGQPLMVLIPSEAPWVVANFKETQLGQIRPGQSVEIEVDALPGETYRGHVDSISSGTGSTFALLPPDNASGNFTKVVQRVPVKIVLDRQPHLDRLRAGLSTVVAISTKS